MGNQLAKVGRLLPSQLRKAIPPKSIDRSRETFRKFTLSKFRDRGLPPNYVPPDSNVGEFQRGKLAEKVPHAQPRTPGMTIALPAVTMKEYLPSLDLDKGTVDLGELIALLTKYRRGTEFYCRGNPTLIRIALDSQVQKLLGGMKGASK